ncbi:TetR family transcriptional regulator [Gordonia amarae]|uniref:TetR family transcriptional regulator n=1 Tax=Gordonia amarae TaxID=36821 RepID=A0A857KLI5_9ACTN|nr:TetR family transcriptional regulator [Gordonia amarae]QHN22614.1 TetR family transcriptional regulator [Gordonia amarae]QHN31480.1 TetR family transcriptional regulator [Gordonia amarae]QHN40224.1 TetR family transcriptional regulator [Gordonia amarae]
MVTSGTRGSRRRVAWGGQGQPEDPRSRIVEAAIRTLATHGLEHTSLTVIAREAQVSRQTVYKYFSTKEEIVEIALERAVTDAGDRLVALARTAGSAEEFVVELCLSVVREFTANPAISPMITVLEQPAARRRLLDPEALALARGYLEPVLGYRPDLTGDLEEMTETFLRFVISLMTFEGPSGRSDDSMRDYLAKVLVPAMGLHRHPPGD